MGRPFSDITLYIPSPHANGTPESRAETGLFNFVSDLYVQHMNGYKPPRATRVTIQPAYYGVWDRVWKFGSIFAVALPFNRKEFESLDRMGKYRYILDMIQTAMTTIGKEQGWENAVFVSAYQAVIEGQFIFAIDYDAKTSKDRKKTGYFRIEKTQTVSSGYVIIHEGESTRKVKLFDKRNWYWSDGIYLLPKCAKWADWDRFGINYGKGALEIWYSLSQDNVSYFQNGQPVEQVDFGNVFSLDSYATT
jgi:hypothetical protein